ncbi:MAG: hypothetical protein JKY96_08530 [Phycisphaerales bacterium]|nr:hypothetical protein [Phycisphaerales bacterium]
MGMIRRADIETYTRDAIAMNLGDIERQGINLVRVANERAEQIIKDANAERDRLLADASEEGRQAGHKEGHAAGFKQGQTDGYQQALTEHTEQITALVEQWSASLKAFSDGRDSMYQQARQDVIELAAAIARRITKRTIAMDPSVVETQMQSVLDSLARPTGLVLRVNAEDLAYAETVLPGLIADCMHCTHAEVVGDDSIDRGSCIAETEGRGRIDASIQTQLARIVQDLLPEHTDQHTDQQTEIPPESQGDAA